MPSSIRSRLALHSTRPSASRLCFGIPRRLTSSLSCGSGRRREAIGSRSRAHAPSRRPDAISNGCAASTPTSPSVSRMPRVSCGRVPTCCASPPGSSRRSRTRSTASHPNRCSRPGLTCATRIGQRRRNLPASITCGSIPVRSGELRIPCRSTRARRRCGSGSIQRGAVITTTKEVRRAVCSCRKGPPWPRRSTPGSPAT